MAPLRSPSIIGPILHSSTSSPADVVELLASTARASGAGVGFKSWVARAFRLGIREVVLRDLGHVDGRLIRTSLGPSIELNVRRPRVRQLFSLAHELGHLMLERRFPFLKSDLKERSLFFSDYNREEERLADALAGAMLMPLLEMKQLIASHESNLSVICDAARRFGVSLSAAAARAEEISGRPCTLLDFRLEASTDELVLVNGNLWRLPFGDSVGSSWRIPLTAAMCQLGLGESSVLSTPVEVFPNHFECFRGEFRWISRTRAGMLFSYQRLSHTTGNQ